MKFSYQVGAPICSIEDPSRKGSVVSSDKGSLWFQWQEDYGSDDRYCVEDSGHEIMPDTPEAHLLRDRLTQQIQAKIDEAASLLEQAFKAWQQAAAIEWYGETNHPENEFFDTYVLKHNPALDLAKFEKVVEANGWSSSSLYC